jgi:GNAT superfamily N-acetyltransferase
MSATAAPSFSIRTAEAGEAELILPCYEWLFAPPGSKPPAWQADHALERLKKTLSDEGSALFIAENEAGEVIGICTVYIDIQSVRYGLRGWVEDLAVAPDSRSAGVGAALLRAAREWAKQRGATHLELDSGVRRTDAHRFYERQDPSWTGIQYAWQL